MAWLGTTGFPAFAASGLPELIERIKPSIMAVGTFDKTRSPPFVMRGTGFAVGNGTLIATNAHVIPEALNTGSNEVLAVVQVLPGGRATQRPASVVASDKTHDLAVLRIAGPPFPPLTLQSGELVREGQDVAFTGFPIGTVLGLAPVTHRGIISAITPVAIPSATAQQLNAKVISRLKTGSFEVYQLDGTAYPGNSGGPLFEPDQGEVIGVINMVFVKGTKESALSQPSGISYAIPVRYLQELLREVR